MSRTTYHRIVAQRSGSHRGVDYEEEWEIGYHYTPGSPASYDDPGSGQTIEFDSLLGNVDAPDFAREVAEKLMNDWAEDWLAENEAEAIANAESDREARADDHADFLRRQRIDDRITGDR